MKTRLILLISLFTVFAACGTEINVNVHPGQPEDEIAPITSRSTSHLDPLPGDTGGEESLCLAYPTTNTTITQGSHGSKKAIDIDCAIGDTIRNPFPYKAEVKKVITNNTARECFSSLSAYNSKCKANKSCNNQIKIQTTISGTTYTALILHIDDAYVTEGTVIDAFAPIATCGNIGWTCSLGGGDGSHVHLVLHGTNIGYIYPGTVLDKRCKAINPTQNPPLPEIKSPAENVTFKVGEKVLFTYKPGSSAEHYIKFRNLDTNVVENPKNLKNQTFFETSFPTEAKMRWTVFYKHHLCPNGECAAVSHFNVRKKVDSSCIDSNQITCGQSGMCHEGKCLETISKDNIAKIFERVGKEENIPSCILKAMGEEESQWNQAAASSDGGKGLMQITGESKLKNLSKQLGIPREKLYEVSMVGVYYNIKAGAMVLNQLVRDSQSTSSPLIYKGEPLEKIETWWFAVTAYNGGGIDRKLTSSNYPFRVYNRFLRSDTGYVPQIPLDLKSFPPGQQKRIASSAERQNGECVARDRNYIPQHPNDGNCYIRTFQPFNINSLKKTNTCKEKGSGCAPICTPGTKRCSGASAYQTCDANGCSWGTAIPCPTNQVCFGGSCRTTCKDQCVVNTKRCSGNAVQTCQKMNTGCTEWTKIQTCDCGCSGNTCVNPVCSPNTKQCSGTSAYQTCDANGCSWGTAISCPTNQVCSSGLCKLPCTNQCTLNAKRCSGNMLQTCHQLSVGCTEWTNTQTCDCGCFGNTCVNPVCSPNTKQCSGASAYQACDANGCSWSAAIPCPTNQVCSGGSCKISCKDQCVVNTKRCSGNTVQTCQKMNTGCTEWTKIQTCDCGCSGNTCVNPVCSPNTKQCSGTSAYQTCDANGCSWGTAISCPTNQVCSSGLCKLSCTNQCTLNAKRCSGNMLQACKLGAKGCLEWIDTRTCDCGCSGNACINSVCTPNAKQCSGSSIQTCDFQGCKWTTSQSCICGCSRGSCKPEINPTQVCRNSTIYNVDQCGNESYKQSCTCGCRNSQYCNVPACTPNQYSCSGSTLKQCSSNGCQLNTKQSCSSSTPYCNASRGRCEQCQSSESRSCNPGTYCPQGTQTRPCNNGSWGSWSTCQASTKYYGDGGKHCGSVVCLQITASGSNGTLRATITKNGGGSFSNNSQITIYSPTTRKSDLKYYYCGAIPAGSSSKTIYIDPSKLGTNVGGTISVNVQVLSPCSGGANYISGSGSISQCRP